MRQREREGDLSSPRMSNDDRALDPNAPAGMVYEVGLRTGRPDPTAGALTVAKSRPVEGDDAVPLSREGQDSTDLPVLDRYAVTVEEDHRGALASLDVVQTNAIHLDEAPAGRVFAFRSARARLDEASRAA
jgi:hypothetical protein